MFDEYDKLIDPDGKKIGIYKIVHLKTNSVYVGQSNNIHFRFEEHRKNLLENIHHNTKLQELWNTGKVEDFLFEDIILAPSNLSPLQTQRWLVLEEQRYIDFYKNSSKYICINMIDAKIVETKKAYAEFEKELEKKKTEKRLENEKRDLIVAKARKEISKRLKEINDYIYASRPDQYNLKIKIQAQEDKLNSFIKKHSGLRSIFNGRKDPKLEKTLSDDLAFLKSMYEQKYQLIDEKIEELKKEKKQLLSKRRTLKSSKQIYQANRSFETMVSMRFGRSFSFKDEKFK